MKQETKDQIRRIFESFLARRMNTIRALRIEDLHINPFLLRLLAREMEFENSEAIVRWLVLQRSMTGVNTSMGFCLQEIAKLFSEGTGVEGADLQKTKEGRRYYIQVKSGPSTMDKDAVQHMSQLLVSVQRRNRGSVALLGMCYGTREQVLSTVKRYSDVDWLIGREFWEFISDDPNCIQIIYDIAGEVSENFRDESGQTISDLLENKVQELLSEFNAIYGHDSAEIWKNLLEKNS